MFIKKNSSRTQVLKAIIRLSFIPINVQQWKSQTLFHFRPHYLQHQQPHLMLDLKLHLSRVLVQLLHQNFSVFLLPLVLLLHSMSVPFLRPLLLVLSVGVFDSILELVLGVGVVVESFVLRRQGAAHHHQGEYEESFGEHGVFHELAASWVWLSLNGASLLYNFNWSYSNELIKSWREFFGSKNAWLTF